MVKLLIFRIEYSLNIKMHFITFGKSKIEAIAYQVILIIIK